MHSSFLYQEVSKKVACGIFTNVYQRLFVYSAFAESFFLTVQESTETFKKTNIGCYFSLKLL
jgi:hypothetical protein